MNKIDEAVRTIEGVGLSGTSGFGRVHPLPKLLVTLLYLVFLTSIPKYRMDLIVFMALFLYVYKMVGDLPVLPALKKLRIIFGMLFLIGLANPIFDRETAFMLGRLPVSYGTISMLTLFFKAVLAVIFGWFLIITTGMAGVCQALASLRLPGFLITVFMLIFRYISVLLQEASRLWTAYSLRAPKQRGVHISAWGSFVGSLLLRSVDRAETVYQSMEMRGFSEKSWLMERKKIDGKSILFLLGWTALMILFRFVPIFTWIGDLLLKR